MATESYADDLTRLAATDRAPSPPPVVHAGSESFRADMDAMVAREPRLWDDAPGWLWTGGVIAVFSSAVAATLHYGFGVPWPW